MARYIDADNLLEKLHRMIDYCEKDRKVNTVSALFQVGDAIMDYKTADVAPVRHGRWIDKGEYAVCTECGVWSGTQYDGVEPIPLMTQFCPNCGAKMDREDM